MKIYRIIGIAAIFGITACGSNGSEDAVEITDSEFTAESVLEETNVDSAQVDEIVTSMNDGTYAAAATGIQIESGKFNFRDREGRFFSFTKSF